MGVIQNQITYRRIRIRSEAVRKGLFGGNRWWTFVLLMILVGHGKNKVLKRGPMPVLFSEKLEPGQSYLITHFSEPSRRRKK